MLTSAIFYSRISHDTVMTIHPSPYLWLLTRRFMDFMEKFSMFHLVAIMSKKL